jgi:monovalent cation:H+ antiporter-2, CPA2 family
MREHLVSAAVSLNSSLTILELGVVFLFLGVLSFVALKLRISSVPLFLLAGLALGKGGLAPLDLSEDFLNVGAEIGALLLLLVLGFEYSANDLVQTLRKRWHTGVADLLLNGIPAAGLAYALGYGPIGALAFGGIMFVSSSGIASQMIRETGWAKSLLAKRVTGALVIEDLLLAPYLPLVASVALGLGAWSGLISVGVAFVITVGIFLLSAGREIPGLRSLSQRGPGVLLLLVFGLALAVAGAANLSGFSGAIAAFLLGMLLSGEIAETLRSRFAPLREIFSAIFFLFFGLSIAFVDVLAVLPIAVAFSLLGVAGKFGLGWWIARDMSDPMSWKRVGAFLSPRGEFSMIIAATVATQATLGGIREITLAIVVLTTIVSTLAIRAFRSRFDQ